jgi:hypothetical protein
VTVEETIEYVLPGLTQVEVDRERMPYPRALEAVMRQDPDVVLLGDLPDAETAKLAIEMSNSGQLVIATVHATSASHAVERLTDLGLPRLQVAHTLAGIVFQRLVRRLCTHCREGVAPSTLIRSALSLPAHVQQVWKPNLKGCRSCGNKGYRGRIAVVEVLASSDRVREAISSGAGRAQLDAIAVAEGTVPLLRDSVEKILSGAVSVEEILRSLCGVTIDDVSALNDPGEMVSFLKTVRDQFLPVHPAPGAFQPPSSSTVTAAQTTGRFSRPPSGRLPAVEEPPARAPAPQVTSRYATPPSAPRPPSDRYPSPKTEEYPRPPAPSSFSRETQAVPAAAGRGIDPAAGVRSEDLLRTLLQTLPPDVAAQLLASRAANGPGASTGATQRVNPNELLKQLQELQRRLQRQGEGGPPA